MNKSLRFFLFLVLALMATAPVVTLAQDEALEDGKLTIAWIPKALNNPVFETGRDGCFLAAEELTEMGPYEVECLYMGSVASDMAEQARIVEDAIAQGVDAIGISCNDPDGCVDPINAAVEAGIPVMTWDSDAAPEAERFTYLGVDNYTGGAICARILIAEMGTEGRIATLTGVPGAANLEARLSGFRDYINENAPDIEVVAEVACDDDINKGVQVVEEVMQANPDLDGWFWSGSWPLWAEEGSMPLYEEATEAGMKVTTFDTLPAMLDWVKAGKMHGLVGQKYWGWGYDTVYMIYDYIVNGAEFGDWTDSGLDVVTANNVDDMYAQWDNMDFTIPLGPAYPPEDGKFTIAWIPKALNNPVFETGRDGCFQAAEELSAKHEGLEVECLYMGSVASDMAEQARIVEDAIAQGVDAIGISCNDPDGCVDPINAAVEAGIPVMTWDSDAAPEAERFTYLGVDNYTGGYKACEMLIAEMGTEGKIATLTGVPGAANLEARLSGFRDCLAEQAPDIEIVAEVACDDDINKGVQVVEEVMQANPDLDGWFWSGSWPLWAEEGSMPLYEAAAEEGMVMTTFDTLPAMLDWVKAGKCHGLVGQKYWGWGYDTMYMLFNYVLNAYVYEDWTDSGMDLVNANNVDDMYAQWENMDFTIPLGPLYPEE